MSNPCPFPLFCPESRPLAVPPIRRWLVRGKELRAALDISASQVAKWIKAGDFPRNVAIGPASRAWVSDELASWFHIRHGLPLSLPLADPAACHDRLLDGPDVTTITGLSRHMRRALAQSGGLVPRFADGPRSALWSLLDVERWIAGLMAARPPNRFHLPPELGPWPCLFRIINRVETEQVTGLHTAHLYALMGAGRFPASRPMYPPTGTPAKGWNAFEVDQWIAGNWPGRKQGLA